VLAASNIMAMVETVTTSETSANVFQTTRRNNPENSRLQFNKTLGSQHLNNVAGNGSLATALPQVQ
jgi:hypothetical protein